MLPAASVSGFYLSHPDSRYFAVDKIGEDQAADYARRKALALEQTERWLAPNLAYEPRHGIAEKASAQLQLRALPAEDPGRDGEAARHVEAACAAEAAALLLHIRRRRLHAG